MKKILQEFASVLKIRDLASKPIIIRILEEKVCRLFKR